MKASGVNVDKEYLAWDENCIWLCRENDAIITKIHSIGVQLTARINAEGVSLWKLCDGTRTLEQIIASLENEYYTPREILVRDVASAVETLSGMGLIITRKEKKQAFQNTYNLENRVRWADDVMLREEEGELIIMNLSTSHIYELPHRFLPILEECKEDHTIAEIQNQVEEERDVVNYVLEYLDRLSLIIVSSEE
ncbi:MAG: PqqD family protein [Candidatus Methanofastidiosia archaeon]